MRTLAYRPCMLRLSILTASLFTSMSIALWRRLWTWGVPQKELVGFTSHDSLPSGLKSGTQSTIILSSRWLLLPMARSLMIMRTASFPSASGGWMLPCKYTTGFPVSFASSGEVTRGLPRTTRGAMRRRSLMKSRSTCMCSLRQTSFDMYSRTSRCDAVLVKPVFSGTVCSSSGQSPPHPSGTELPQNM